MNYNQEEYAEDAYYHKARIVLMLIWHESHADLISMYSPSVADFLSVESVSLLLSVRILILTIYLQESCQIIKKLAMRQAYI